MNYDPYEPHEGEQSVETAGPAAFLDWLAARFDALVQQAKDPDRWKPTLSANEVKPYPYELAACAERIRDLESTLREFLDLLDKGKLASMNLEEKARRLVRTPEEWREWEKKDDAKFRKEERNRIRREMAGLSPEDKKRYRAQYEIGKRLLSGKD